MPDTYPARFDHETVEHVADIPIPGTDEELACDWGDPQACQDDNNLRAEFAGLALRAYADRTGGITSEPVEQVISDLLNDLRHLCDALDLNFEALALDDRHYLCELAGSFR